MLAMVKSRVLICLLTIGSGIKHVEFVDGIID